MNMPTSTKPRYRVKSDGSAVTPLPAIETAAPRPMAGRFLRDSRSAVISTRMAPLTDSRDNIRRSWRRVAGIAQDLIMNSGRLSGAMQQIISDTIGSELQLNPLPDVPTLTRMGYDDKEILDLKEAIKREWKYWSWNPSECDYRGKLTVPQMTDIGLRQYIAYGETTGIVEYVPMATRRRKGMATGTKVMMMAPSRLVQDTNEAEGLFQGIHHDEMGRPVQYTFTDRQSGFTHKVPYAAKDGSGLTRVIHAFDPMEADDVRGISPMAGAFRKYIQHEMLEDATLQMAVLQTSLAVALTSEAPSPEAFEALQELSSATAGSASQQAAEGFLALYGSQLSAAAEGTISFGTDPRISKLAPGEKLDVQGTTTPGPQYDEFSGSLSRDTARALGITYEGYTLDHRGSTYVTSRMSIASIWPVVMRRRDRVSAPTVQPIYEGFLDECAFTGRIPFKGGYEAFKANRDRLFWTQWRGPAKPSADDQKSAKASTERMNNFTSSMEIEASELGHDSDELRERQHEEHVWYTSRGMRSPYDRAGQAKAGPDDDLENGDEKPSHSTVGKDV